MHAYEGHAYGMASVRNAPMRDTPIYIGWRKGVAFVAGGGVEYGSAGLSRSTRPGFSTSQDDLGKTKRSLGLGAAYPVPSRPRQTKTSGQDPDKVPPV
jgi:hypothetical protein